MKDKLLLGSTTDGTRVGISPGMANRHGLISGATGTGKTITLQVLAESFSRIGVPVFTADVKGDLSGLASSGVRGQKIEERVSKIGIDDYVVESSPVCFWDLEGKNGHPVRTTLSEMGPILIGRLLDLNETQQGILEIAFAVADDQGLLLLDLKDLRELISWIGDNAKELRKEYGNIAPQSIGAIQRRLLRLREAGAETFFGEPALKLSDMMRLDTRGQGIINILDATEILEDARLYSTFLLWLMSELFEELPEVGDAEKPKMVFFFDEAHLLFDEAPKELLRKIEQVVRLIRSKGVGIYFVTQSPLDIPDEILGQLGHKLQHALRAFTPRDKKAVRAAASTFRENPKLATAEVITQLGVGEALVSVLNEKGQPTVVEQVLCAPPRSKIGPCDPETKDRIIQASPLREVYTETVDRESAYEQLLQREKELRQVEKDEKPSRRSNRQSFGEAFFKSLLRSVGRGVGQILTRGILGSARRRR